MTRLESFIARMQAQRLLLDRACADLNQPGAIPGTVIELGLGNGRTYDHMRSRLPDRHILVFERDPRPNERSWPPLEDLHVGEIEHIASRFAAANPHGTALVHADLGDGTRAGNAQLERWLPQLCFDLAGDNGWIISSTLLEFDGLQPVASGLDFATSSCAIYRARVPHNVS